VEEGGKRERLNFKSSHGFRGFTRINSRELRCFGSAKSV
jgi:hypothetical protein